MMVRNIKVDYEYIFLGVNNDKSIGGCEKWTEQTIHLKMCWKTIGQNTEKTL